MSRFIAQLQYSGEKLQPTITLSDGDVLLPLGRTITLKFDLSVRFCVGWHDMATEENHPCQENAHTDKKYSSCVVCQKRTGFNPAFYHSITVSPQQEARNAEPHDLYLAYMGEDYMKIGISWHGRNMKRLLDQGARAGLLLETFPTALIARQYEAKIARLDGIHETTATRTKLTLLNKPFNEAVAEEHLLSVKRRITDELTISLAGNDVQFFDKIYAHQPVSSGPITPMKNPIISGVVEAMIGDIVITSYEHRRLALPVKQFIGYPVEVNSEITPLDLEPEQMQLF